MNRAEARQVALGYVRSKVINGATRRSLNALSHEGFGAPGEPGYLFSHGRITVPGLPYKGEQHTFPPDELIDELNVGQGDLFGISA